MSNSVFILPDGTEVTELLVKTRFHGDKDTDVSTQTVKAEDAYFAPPVSIPDWATKVGQEGGISTWDFGRILGAAGSYLRQTLRLHLRDGAEFTADEARGFLEKCLSTIEEIEAIGKRLGEASEKAYDAYDDAYRGLASRRRRFEQEVGELGKDIRVPYGLDQIVEFAERFDRLSPEAWAKVLELAEVLQGPRRQTAEKGTE